MKKDLDKKFKEFQKKKNSKLDKKFEEFQHKKKKKGIFSRLLGKKPIATKSKKPKSTKPKVVGKKSNKPIKPEVKKKWFSLGRKPKKEPKPIVKPVKKEIKPEIIPSPDLKKEKVETEKPTPSQEIKKVITEKPAKSRFSFFKKKKIEDIEERIKKEKEDLKQIDKKKIEKKVEKPKEPEKTIATDKKQEPKKKEKKSIKKLFTKAEREKSDDEQEQDIRKLFRKKAKEKKVKFTAAERRRRLDDYLEKGGLEIDQHIIAKRIFYISLVLTLVLTAAYVYMNVVQDATISGIFLQVLVIWILGFLVMWGASWVFFRIYLDLLMFKRKLSVEEVLPDFLQLTSANLRAGMPIDRALWFAVRPRFGVLAKEIEDTAKRTLAGEDLNEALLNFAHKYDSQILTRSVYLLNEGMAAGGDVADLLNKIALNIQEMRGMKKEMSANVTTYVIFISFASMTAAPFLFGLSGQLLQIVQSISSDVAASGGAPQGGIGLSINMSSETIKMSDFQIFVYLALIISSIFSAIIVATIKKGNVKEGLQYIPIFVMVSLIVYFMASKILAAMFGGFF